MQTNLFEQIILDKDGVNPNEAPEGFYATLKVDKGENICRQCDARQLCCENKDDWCINNRCMSDEVFVVKYNKIIKRNDGKPVVFKRK